MRLMKWYGKPVQPSQLQLLLTGFLLKHVDSYKFLGLLFDIHMNWNAHAHKLRESLLKASFPICRLISSGRTPGALVVRTLVDALLLSKIRYGLGYEGPLGTL